MSFIVGSGPFLSAQPSIVVTMDLDTAKWAPVAYLSLIQDFTNLNTIAYEDIIEQSILSESGQFEFNTEFLPKEVHLYRIHLSKIGDPSASLIIGGKDQNHFFLFAERDAAIVAESYSGENLFNNLTFYGYAPNQALFELNTFVNLLDSLDYLVNPINRKFIREAVYNNLREYADTCSNPLVSLYAIYQTNFESDYLVNPAYYGKYLKKWSTEQSDYFNVFRKYLDAESASNWVYVVAIIIGIVVIILIMLAWRRWNNPKNPLSDLTIQERKVFMLLREGKTNKEVAEECNVSLSTVKSHVSNIFSKLAIGSRKEIMNIEI